MFTSQHQQPGLNFWTGKVYCFYTACSRAINDRQPTGISHWADASIVTLRIGKSFSDRTYTPKSWSVHKLRSCVRIMFIEYETYSLKCLSPIKFNYISDFVLIWLPPSFPPAASLIIPVLILTLILILAGHTFRTTTQVTWMILYSWRISGNGLAETHSVNDIIQLT